MPKVEKDYDRIANTARVIDPMHDAVIAGTAGIALHLCEVSWPIGAPGPQDVDFIAEQQVILAMHERAQGSPFVLESALNRRKDEYQIPVGHTKLEVTMADRERLLDVNAFTKIDDNAYDISAKSAVEESVMIGGERTLPLDTLLTWKIMAGRTKDLYIGEVLVNVADSHGLLPSAAIRSLRATLALQRKLVAQRQQGGHLARQ